MDTAAARTVVFANDGLSDEERRVEEGPIEIVKLPSVVWLELLRSFRSISGRQKSPRKFAQDRIAKERKSGITTQ